MQRLAQSLTLPDRSGSAGHVGVQSILGSALWWKGSSPEGQAVPLAALEVCQAMIRDWAQWPVWRFLTPSPTGAAGGSPSKASNSSQMHLWQVFFGLEKLLQLLFVRLHVTKDKDLLQVHMFF